MTEFHTLAPFNLCRAIRRHIKNTTRTAERQASVPFLKTNQATFLQAAVAWLPQTELHARRSFTLICLLFLERHQPCYMILVTVALQATLVDEWGLRYKQQRRHWVIMHNLINSNFISAVAVIKDPDFMPVFETDV